MSRRLPRQDDRRFDFALDMSLRQHHDAHDDNEDIGAVAASSVVEPWSPYNTRPQSDRSSPFADSDWSMYDYSAGGVVCTDYSMPIFDTKFEPLDPTVRLTSPDPANFSTCTTPGNSWLSAPLTTTPSAVSMPPQLNKHDGLSHCPECGQEFTGTYRSGNLLRHRKQKHFDTREDPYSCTFSGCLSVFRRSDARLKHARLKHPGLRLPPAQRRHGTECGSLPRGANDDKSMKAMQTHIPSALANDEVQTRPSDPTSQDSVPPSYLRTPNHVRSSAATGSATGPATPNTDRTRSDESYAARSSQQLNSMLTYPSSSYSPCNPNFLSPYSPSNYRRTSLPSNVQPDAPRLSRAFPSRRSLPDNSDDCIAPSLLDLPHDSNGLDSLDFRFCPPGNGY
ncbi:hypothetical protein DE146DRAFT_283620 [Phaeosphaeria sp. MPI-PUGE-AT-0046c]|nr:hypothetical protein DE146DRAFT_283620 [Phaeosphaeria sp. MPI-PUGE-AT-0046c]